MLVEGLDERALRRRRILPIPKLCIQLFASTMTIKSREVRGLIIRSAPSPARRPVVIMAARARHNYFPVNIPPTFADEAEAGVCYPENGAGVPFKEARLIARVENGTVRREKSECEREREREKRERERDEKFSFVLMTERNYSLFRPLLSS